MSTSLELMSRKISSASRVGRVVHMMKLIAASQIKRCEQAAAATQNYADNIARALYVLFKSGEYVTSRTMARRAVVAIVLGTDQGLVGSFNDQLVSYVAPILRGYEERQIFVFGERAARQLEDEGFSLAKRYAVPPSVVTIGRSLRDVLLDLEPLLVRDQETPLVVFHNRLVSGKQYEPVSTRMLPLDETWKEGIMRTPWPTKQIPELFDGGRVAFLAILREYVLMTLSRALVESLESENVSRLLAMQRAEKNINDLLSDLQLQFMLFRQTAVDAELFDVIAGFSALSKGGGL